MAYNIHIVKKDNWFEKGSDITLEEWAKLLHNDPELVPVEKAEGMTKDGKPFELKMDNTHLAKWQKLDSNDVTWLSYHDGMIDISNPDDIVLEKAKDIAQKLGAKVQGDEGEMYE